MLYCPSKIQIISALRRGPMSRRDIEEATGMRSGPVCARVQELKTMGKLQHHGHKTCAYTGKTVEVLVLARQQEKNNAELV